MINALPLRGRGLPEFNQPRLTSPRQHHTLKTAATLNGPPEVVARQPAKYVKVERDPTIQVSVIMKICSARAVKIVTITSYNILSAIIMSFQINYGLSMPKITGLI